MGASGADFRAYVSKIDGYQQALLDNRLYIERGQLKISDTPRERALEELNKKVKDLSVSGLRELSDTMLLDRLVIRERGLRYAPLLKKCNNRLFDIDKIARRNMPRTRRA